MANITGVAGNIPLALKTYKQVMGLGEKALSQDFEMSFPDYPGLKFLVQNVQVPELGREPAEGFGPHGVQFKQQGRYINAAESPITFMETLRGHLYGFIRDWVLNKRYLRLILTRCGESLPEGNENTTTVLEDCWIKLDGCDLSTEDNTLIKPSGTLYVNWIGHDPETNTETAPWTGQ